VFKLSAKEPSEQMPMLEQSILSTHSEISWVTTAKDFCGELISGQSTSGRILVIWNTFIIDAFLEFKETYF
jgi:hypothetical protein